MEYLLKSYNILKSQEPFHIRRYSQGVRQRSATPLSPVQIWVAPPRRRKLRYFEKPAEKRAFSYASFPAPLPQKVTRRISYVLASADITLIACYQSHQSFILPFARIIPHDGNYRACRPREGSGNPYTRGAERAHEYVRKYYSCRKLRYARYCRGVHVARAAQNV